MTDKPESKQAEENKQREGGERLMALFKLMSVDEQAIGDKPTLEEIQAWYHGELEEKRSSEVKSHVARDPEVFSLWKTIRDIEADEKKLSTRILNLWLRLKQRLSFKSPIFLGGGLVTAFSIMLLFIVLPLHRGSWSPLDNPIEANITYDWPYYGRGVTRSSGINYQHKIALQAGLYKGIWVTTKGKKGWQVALNALPSRPQSCDKEANVVLCKSQTRLLVKTGAYAAIAYLACREIKLNTLPKFKSDFWKKLSVSWSELSKELEKGKLNSFSELIRPFLSESSNVQTICENTKKILDKAF